VPVAALLVHFLGVLEIVKVPKRHLPGAVQAGAFGKFEGRGHHQDRVQLATDMEGPNLLQTRKEGGSQHVAVGDAFGGHRDGQVENAVPRRSGDAFGQVRQQGRRHRIGHRGTGHQQSGRRRAHDSQCCAPSDAAHAVTAPCPYWQGVHYIKRTAFR